MSLNDIKKKLEKEYDDEMFYNPRNPNTEAITKQLQIIRIAEERNLDPEEESIVNSALNKILPELDKFNRDKLWKIKEKLLTTKTVIVKVNLNPDMMDAHDLGGEASVDMRIVDETKDMSALAIHFKDSRFLKLSKMEDGHYSVDPDSDKDFMRFNQPYFYTYMQCLTCQNWFKPDNLDKDYYVIDLPHIFIGKTGYCNKCKKDV